MSLHPDRIGPVPEETVRVAQSELWHEQMPSSLGVLPEIEGLRAMWIQQIFGQEGVLRLRKKDDVPPARLTVRSPYNHSAHYGHKRDIGWFGYKVHFSETKPVARICLTSSRMW